MSETGFEENRKKNNLKSDIVAANDCTLNQAFDLLGNQRRRYVLEALHQKPETPMSVGDLADHVLTRDPDADDRDRVLVGLHHKILPRLADDGAIDFDTRTETVRYQGGELVDSLLAGLDRENGT